MRGLTSLPDPDLVEAATIAVPPPGDSTRIFEPFVVPTRHLLARGVTLTAAAEWFISRGVF